jgi:plastocyanin
MKRLSPLALAGILLVFAGCGSSSKSSSSTSAAPSSSSTTASASAPSSAPSSGGAVSVSMKNLAFSPSTVSAKVGQTIQWTNDDTVAHNVVWVSGPKIPSSSTLSGGAKFSVKLTAAGTINYFCSIHPFMKAKLVVSP